MSHYVLDLGSRGYEQGLVAIRSEWVLSMVSTDPCVALDEKQRGRYATLHVSLAQPDRSRKCTQVFAGAFGVWFALFVGTYGVELGRMEPIFSPRMSS